MRLKLAWLLLQQTDGSPTQGSQSQAPSGNDGAQPDNSATLDELNQNRTDGDVEDSDAGDLDWAKASERIDDSDPEEQPAEKPQPQTPAPEQKPLQQPPQEPKPSVQQPQTPPGTTQPQTQPDGTQPQQKPADQSQQPPQQQPPAETDQQRDERLKREREEHFKSLETYYKVPDDLAARLQTEPEAVLPHIAARLHQRVFEDVTRLVHQSVPQMIQQQALIAEADRSAKEAFFDRWPSLKGHDKKIIEVATMYSQMNPKATPEEKLEMVGSIVAGALGITPDPKPGQRTNGMQPRTPVQQSRPVAPRPAATQSSNAGATPPPDNIYAQMAEDLLQDDVG